MSRADLNPRTTPLGVLLVAGLPTAQAVEVAGHLDTPAIIERAIRAEGRCLARSAVLDALRVRLARQRKRLTTKDTKGRKTR